MKNKTGLIKKALQRTNAYFDLCYLQLTVPPTQVALTKRMMFTRGRALMINGLNWGGGIQVI